MNSQQATKLIELLELLIRRPSMLLGKVDVDLAVAFLNGYRTTLSCAFGFDRSVQAVVIAERGWKMPGASGPGIDQQMVQKGSTPEQVIEELATIEIECIRRSIADTPDTTSITTNR